MCMYTYVQEVSVGKTAKGHIVFSATSGKM